MRNKKKKKCRVIKRQWLTAATNIFRGFSVCFDLSSEITQKWKIRWSQTAKLKLQTGAHGAQCSLWCLSCTDSCCLFCFFLQRYVVQLLLHTVGLHSCLANWRLGDTWLDFGFSHTAILLLKVYWGVTCLTISRSAKAKRSWGFCEMAVCRHCTLPELRRSSTAHCEVKPLDV